MKILLLLFIFFTFAFSEKLYVDSSNYSEYSIEPFEVIDSSTHLKSICTAGSYTSSSADFSSFSDHFYAGIWFPVGSCSKSILKMSDSVVNGDDEYPHQEGRYSYSLVPYDCEQPYLFDPSSETCSCPSPFVESAGECVCPTGLVAFSPEPCPSIANGGTESAPSCVEPCSPGLRRGSSGACLVDCQEEFCDINIWNIRPNYSAIEIDVAPHCEFCPNGYVPNFDNTACLSCPSGEVPAVDSPDCFPDCSESGAYYYPVSESCGLVVIGVDSFCYDCDINSTGRFNDPTPPPDDINTSGDDVPDSVDTNSSDSLNYDDSLEQIGDNINNVYNNINNVVNSTNENTQAVNQLGSRIDQTNTKLDGLSSGVDQTNTKLDGLSSKVDQTNTKLDGLSSKFDNNNSFPSFDFTAISSYSGSILSDIQTVRDLYSSTYSSVTSPFSYVAPVGGGFDDITVSILGSDYVIPMNQYVSSIAPFVVFLMRLAGIVLAIKIYIYSISVMFRS